VTRRSRGRSAPRADRDTGRRSHSGAPTMELLPFFLLLLFLYFAVKLGGALLARLTGARYRAYRALARRYRGRCENRGLVDPPTVSFSYRDSSVRVGLAPIVPGQPNPPRTRVVVRFPEGLPFRFELIPSARPPTKQPARGTRPVRIGDPAFDRAFVCRANDEEMARAFLAFPEAKQAVHELLKLCPPKGLILSVNPERLLVQVDRNLGQHLTPLNAAVSNTLVLRDCLTESVAHRVRDGIQIVDEAPVLIAGDVVCKVCNEPIGLDQERVVCSTCNTPHHRDCWSFVGGCSIYGCQGKRCAPA